MIGIMGLKRFRTLRDKPVSTKRRRKSSRSLGSVKFLGTVGDGVTPHTLTANPGENVVELIAAFSATTTMAFWVISASGVLSSATFSNIACATKTFEGRLEIKSLSGEYIPFEKNGSQVQSRGLTVSFFKPDGKLYGGYVTGSLLAETPVQIQILSYQIRETRCWNYPFVKATT